ncbi:hypothetical protein [Luminiphilus syltensis]|uniref:hypothetical protein n=1 Tax=Luminiphilus syltensis TaxID=1341119 RepID=UPI0012B66DC0|nr:hypothetical protein [Luminiphilus syltensis]
MTAMAVPVPSMSPIILSALGFFLVVVALRSLRQSTAARRILGLSVLGIGSAITALGIERSIAGNVPILTPTDCPPGGDIVVQIPNIAGSNVVSNQCPIDLFLKSYQFDCDAISPRGGFLDDSAAPPETTPFPAGADLQIGRCLENLNPA